MLFNLTVQRKVDEKGDKNKYEHQHFDKDWKKEVLFI